MTVAYAGIAPDRPALPWGLFLFLHLIFFFANLDPDKIPFPVAQAATVEAIEQSQEQGMLGRRIAFIALGAVAIVSLVRGDRRRLSVNSGLGILMVGFLIWSSLSVLWAEDPVFTGKKLIAFGLLWAGAGWCAVRLATREILLFAFLSNVLTWLASLAVEVGFGVFTPWVGGYRFAGLYHPNEAGQCLGVAVLAGLVLFYEARGRAAAGYLVAVAGAAAFLLLSGSRTALLCTISAVTATLIIAEVGRKRIRGLIGAGAILGAVLAATYLFLGVDWAETILSALSSGRADSDLATLTLRTPMWKELIDIYVTARPLTGYGYGGFWTPRHVLALSLLQRGTVYYHSHSGYLEMALSIGIVGALVHVLTIVWSLWKSLARGVSGDPVEAFAAGVLIMLMIGMGAEPVNMSAYLMPTFLAMILISKHAFQGEAA